MTEIETIAKGLTKAQREALSVAWLEGAYFETLNPRLRLRACRGRSTAALFRRGMVCNIEALARLTPLGLAVREYLKQEERDDG
jgi:hypothetical protein